MLAVGAGGVDAPAVRGGSPFNAAVFASGANRCSPQDRSVGWIESPIDSAFLAKADVAFDEIGARASEVVVRSRRRRTRGAGPGSGAGQGPHIISPQPL